MSLVPEIFFDFLKLFSFLKFRIFDLKRQKEVLFVFGFVYKLNDKF